MPINTSRRTLVLVLSPWLAALIGLDLGFGLQGIFASDLSTPIAVAAAAAVVVTLCVLKARFVSAALAAALRLG